MSKLTSVELIASAARPEDLPRGGSLPEVAVVGRSNVGKSSLLNRLAGVRRMAFVSKTPGRTQLVNFFRVADKMMLVDLPGYGFAKAPVAVRRNWEELVTTYLFERDTLCLCLLLVDARRDPQRVDIEVRDLLEAEEVSYTVVATKVDKLSGGRIRQKLAQIEKVYGAAGNIPVIGFSAVTGEGRKELWKVIERHVRAAKRAPKK